MRRVLKSGRQSLPPQINSLVRRILDAEPDYQQLDDQALRKESLRLRFEILSGTPSDELLVEAFALVREAARRTLGLIHYPVQLHGGIVMHYQGIAVMQTGEGKTLTATLPLFLAALSAKGAHLATANDYLAARDARQMTPLFASLGLSTGTVLSSTSQIDRPEEWGRDITYSTAKEIGFDFLRDRLAVRARENGTLSVTQLESAERSVNLQRGLEFVLVDEADSILIDEARTPLVISGHGVAPRPEKIAVYQWANQNAPMFSKPSDYETDIEKRSVTLTSVGRQKVRRSQLPELLQGTSWTVLYEHLVIAITVREFFRRDRDYVVRDGEVTIVDEFTGRFAEGRRWRSGIHQAIEAMESVEITPETVESARMTLQDLFLRYNRRCGMTGTVAGSAAELEKIYSVNVADIPTNRPPQRIQVPSVVTLKSADRWEAVASQIQRIHSTGQPVLAGTRSIDKSEVLSRLLGERGIRHSVLNARNNEREAELIAGAGEPGAVTVSTNMAGRGTDIRVPDRSLALGGLFVIVTEMHDSERIDRQLIGRCGRQGDPGTWQMFMSFEDELLTSAFSPRKVSWLRKSFMAKNSAEFGANLFRKAQRIVEARHFHARKMLLHNERQRHETQIELGMDPYLDAPQES